MNQIRDILNKIKWHQPKKMPHILIWYIHRGAPQNIKCITGDTIISIHKTFLETEHAMIPHHRIQKITYYNKNNNTTLFNRQKKHG